MGGVACAELLDAVSCPTLACAAVLAPNVPRRLQRPLQPPSPGLHLARPGLHLACTQPPCHLPTLPRGSFFLAKTLTTAPVEIVQVILFATVVYFMINFQVGAACEAAMWLLASHLLRSAGK